MGRGGHYIRVVGENGELGGRQWVSNKEFDRLRKARQNQSDLLSQRQLSGTAVKVDLNKSKAPKTTKKNSGIRGQEVDSYIRNQINIDINQYRDDFTKRYDKKDAIVLHGVPKNIQNQLKSLSTAYGSRDFVIEEAGANLIQITSGKALERYVKQMDRLWGKGKWR